MRLRSLLVLVSFASSLTACGPNLVRRVGERWTIEGETKHEGTAEPSTSKTLYLVEGVDTDGSAQIAIVSPTDNSLVGTLVVDSSGQTIAFLGARTSCYYQKPFGWGKGPLTVGSTVSLDNTQTCDPKKPRTVSGTAKVEAREKLDTVLGSLDVVKLSGTRRYTTTDDPPFEETFTVYWSERYQFEVSSVTNFTSTPATGEASRGTSDLKLTSYTPAPD